MGWTDRIGLPGILLALILWGATSTAEAQPMQSADEQTAAEQAAAADAALEAEIQQRHRGFDILARSFSKKKSSELINLKTYTDAEWAQLEADVKANNAACRKGDAEACLAAGQAYESGDGVWIVSAIFHPVPVVPARSPIAQKRPSDPLPTKTVPASSSACYGAGMASLTLPPRILSIAGSDSSGGAGIQADIKTITMLGGYAMTAITAITAQNTLGVQGVAPISPEMVAQQIASCVEDIGVDAVKIGMLASPEVIAAVAEALSGIDAPVVLDPVMIATSGAVLVGPEAVAALREMLFPRAGLLTPNLPELAHLAGRELPTHAAMVAAAEELAAATGAAVLAKGGHTQSERITDVLVVPGEAPLSFDHARIDTRHTHGTGCTLSSAIATLLGRGESLPEAVRLARQFVLQAIEAAPGYGAGSGPLGHQAVRAAQPSAVRAK